MLYPTKAGGETYVMPSTIFQRKGITPKYDSGRVMVMGDGGEFEQVLQGVVRLTQNNNVQLCFTTSKGYATSEITTDRNTLTQARFMQTIKDWHNIEFTVSFKYLGGNDDGAIVIGTRGGIGALDPCEGFQYKAGINLDASGGFFSKQQYSTSGNEYREFNTTKMGSSIKGKFVAIKFVIYDLDHEGQPTTISEDAEHVKMELYGTSDGSSPFRQVKETTDDGNWGQAAVCGGDAGVIGLWGGPISTLEWRDGADIQIQSISIREIDPTANFDDIPQLSSITFTPPENTDPEPEGSSGVDTFGVQMIHPTKSGGKTWFSTLWNNGHSRNLAQDQFDPDDPRLGYVRGGTNSNTMAINGDGTATLAVLNTHRIFVDGPWLNTEITVYTRFRTSSSPSSFQLRSRSNHHGVQDLPYGLESSSPEISCGWGNYETAWTCNQNKVGQELEVIHDLYVRNISESSSPRPANNVWTGYKQVTRTVNGNKVRVEGWILRDVTDQTKWTKESEFTYDGTNIHVDPSGHEINVSTCLNKGDNVSGNLDANALRLIQGKWCWIRINEGQDIDLKFFSVREINPDPPTVATTQSVTISALAATGTQAVGQVNDSLGVQQIYKTKPGGSVWVSTKNGLLSDKQFSDNNYDIKSNGDGTYSVNNDSRIQSFSTKAQGDKGPDFDGYATHDFEELRKRGAWDSTTTDWRDVEMTGYVKMTASGSSGSGDELSFVVRSVRHNNASNNGCGGSSYHGNLHNTGHGRFKKEQWHVKYQNDDLLEKGFGSVKGKTVGFKFVCYNINDNKAVQLELYIDKDNNNTWEFMGSKIDAGDWTTSGTPDMKHCGATSNLAIISWGSPKVIWKWNLPLKVDISKMSVREIIPEKEDGTTPGGGTGGGTGGGDGGGDPPATGGTGQLSRVQTTYECIYDVIVDSTGNTCAGAAPPSGTGVYNEVTALTVTTITNDKSLAASWSSEDDRDRVGWTCEVSDALIHGIRPTKVGVYLKKVGSPTGNASVIMRDSSDNIKVTYGTIDVSTLTTSYVLHENEFVEDNAATLMGQGFANKWKLSVEYNDPSSNSANHLDVGVNYNNPVDGTKTYEIQHEKEPGPGYSYIKHTDRDMAGKLYTSPA